MSIRAIDPWVNVNMGDNVPPEWLIRVKEDYFKGGADFLKNIEIDELLPTMDEVGLTVSLGVASLRDGELDAGDLVEAADAQLYRAKSLGRNRVCSKA